MEESLLTDLEQVFLALSDKTRLRLLALIANGESAVGVLADELGESQPKISRHLAYLRTAGVVSARREGKRIFYYIQRQRDSEVEGVLNAAVTALASSGMETDSLLLSEQGRRGEQPIIARDYTSGKPYTSDAETDELPVFLL